jgi:hypothetical protein
LYRKREKAARRRFSPEWMDMEVYLAIILMLLGFASSALGMPDGKDARLSWKLRSCLRRIGIFDFD